MTEAAIAEIARDGDFDLAAVELNKTVVRIEREKGGEFLLTLEGGDTVTAQNVIITVALPIFQQRRIEIDFMPPKRYEMMDRV